MKNVLLNVILVFTDIASLVDKSKHVDTRYISKIRKKQSDTCYVIYPPRTGTVVLKSLLRCCQGLWEKNWPLE